MTKHRVACVSRRLATVALGVIVAAGFGIGRPATASDRSPSALNSGASSNLATSPTTAAIDAAAAIAAVRAAGYGPVRHVEWEHGRWHIASLDASGQRVRLVVDATSGAVTRRTSR